MPADWIRRQSLANAERFVTPALKELEEKILGAEDRIGQIEERLYRELLAELSARRGPRRRRPRLRSPALDLARRASPRRPPRALGAAAALGRAALSKLVDGRHPIVEALRREEPFVPNDCDLSPERRILLVTGPNMGGKSTYLRQVATAVLLAQAGSFVPAASLGDARSWTAIFTRVGAADHLSRGESTFMVEMLEAAAILREATPRAS